MTSVTTAPVSIGTLEDPAGVVEAYERWLLRGGLSPATKRVYLSQVRGFVSWLTGQLEHKPVDVFTDPRSRDFAVRDYRRWLLGTRKRTPSSVNTALGAVASLFDWLGLGRPDVPAANLQKRAPKALTVEQTRSVLRAAERRGPRDHALVAVMVGAGLRAAEVHGLDVDDVWVSERKGEVSVLGKGDKPRKVPLNVETRRPLAAWITARRSWPGAGETPALFLSRDGKRLTDRSVRNIVAEAGDAVGVRLHPHMLRHTFATVLERNGVPLSVIADLLGHASIQTTMVYTRPNDDDVAAAVEAATFDY